MSMLAIPDSGLLLESSNSRDLPLQAFGITLNDSVIEDMIRCVQSGQGIELHLGNGPCLRYGDDEEPLKPTAESFDYELYLTNDAQSKAQRLPYPAMSIMKKPTGIKAAKSQSKAATKAGKAGKAKPGPRAMAMALSQASTTKSMPSSPALSGIASPSHNPAITASQQLFEKNKEQRTTLVHELAVRDQSFDYLKERWSGSEGDLTSTLRKVADMMGDKWSMKKIYWKELDVWNYTYSPPENRQLAIENARKQFDKQRLETKDPAWERLLEEKDRGKGIVLSKLQAAIANRTMTPAQKPPKADDASGKNSSDESVKGKANGEAMARSNSQPVGPKPKKVSDREPQSKSLLSNKSTTAKKPAPVKKAPPPSKPKAAADKGGKKFLSEEFVHDSSSDDEVPLATTTAPKPKPVEKPVEKPIERIVEKLPERPVEKEKPKERSPAPPPVKQKTKPMIRAPRPAAATVKAPPTAPKRQRDEDDSSSSSGAPLSKRTKPKEAPTATKTLPNNTTLKHRPSDASQNSRGTPSNVSYKSKNTSPAKSSPLASSPPTNASDLDDNSHSSHSQSQHREDRAPRNNGYTTTNGTTTNGVSAPKKRPAESQHQPQQAPPAKKARVSREVLNKALMFDKCYEQYRLLHEQLTRMTNPPRERVDDLIDMRERLANWKREIRREVQPAA